MARIFLIAFVAQPALSIDCTNGCTISSSQFPFTCVDLTGGKTTEGELLQIWHCNGLKNQEWLWHNGAFQFSGNRSKCMTAKGKKLETNTLVGLETCTGKASQKWGVDQMGRLSIGGAQNLCLAPVSDAFAPGTEIRLFTCTYYLDQFWRLQVGPGPPSIAPPNWNMAVNVISEFAPSMCLDVQGGSAKVGTALDLWDCNSLLNQRFLFNKDSTISYIADLSLCIDITGDLKKGSRMQLQKCNAKSTQKFQYDTKLATLTASNVTSNTMTCLDAPDAKPMNGSKVWLWECSRQPQQQWYFSNPPVSAQSDPTPVFTI